MHCREETDVLLLSASHEPGAASPDETSERRGSSDSDLSARLAWVSGEWSTGLQRSAYPAVKCRALVGFKRRIGCDGGKGRCTYQALVVIVSASIAISFPYILYAFLCRHRKNRLLEPDHRCASSSPLPISAPGRTSSELSSSWSLYGSAVDSSLKKLSLDDLSWAIGELSPDNIIDDRLSADHAAGAGNREFRVELEVLGSLSHRNLVALLRSQPDSTASLTKLERGSSTLVERRRRLPVARVPSPRGGRRFARTTTATRPCSTATSSPATYYSTRGLKPANALDK
ncbi:hypothetical protein ZWY2020_020901 [Hordeum vulgare]|nr:hypothetical protein ZWY2020_020901 [Hordeum vulgare]